MNIRRFTAAAVAGLALAGAGAFAAPSTALEAGGITVPVTCGAADTCSGSSPVQLTVTGGGTLAISVPAPASGSTHIDLGTVAAGTLAATTGSLGEVSVTDQRTGILNNNWVVAASASDLILSGKTAGTAAVNEKIPALALGYDAGTLTKAVQPVVPAVATALTGVTLAAPAPVVTTVSLGANTVKWSPTLVVSVLPTTVAGVYTGTVTHSAL